MHQEHLHCKIHFSGKPFPATSILSLLNPEPKAAGQQEIEDASCVINLWQNKQEKGGYRLQCFDSKTRVILLLLQPENEPEDL